MKILSKSIVWQQYPLWEYGARREVDMINIQQPSLQPASRSPSVKREPMVRLLSKRQLKEMIPYTGQHIQRLEDAGKFPKRVRLGEGPRSRVGWLESEVLEWLRERIEARDKGNDSTT